MRADTGIACAIRCIIRDGITRTASDGNAAQLQACLRRVIRRIVDEVLGFFLARLACKIDTRIIMVVSDIRQAIIDLRDISPIDSNIVFRKYELRNRVVARRLGILCI